MSFFLPSMTSYLGSKPLSTSTLRSFLGRSLMCPSDALTTYCLPRYLLMVFALAGDSTITRALAILRFQLGTARPWRLQITQLTLPHFYKVLSRKLFDQPQHLQLEES